MFKLARSFLFIFLLLPTMAEAVGPVYNATSPLVLSPTNYFSIPVATTSVSGYLSASDWTTFSTKLTSPLTTKGDILGFSTVNARLAVGTNAQVLTADSTQTLGVKWADASATGLTALTGDVSASGSGSVVATVNSVGGSTASAVNTGVVLANAATSADTVSAIVRRDSSGNFSAGTVTAALTGTASGNTSYTANNHGVVFSSASNAMTVLAPDSSTNKVLVSGGSSADPAWALLTNSNLSGSAAVSNANLATMSNNTMKGNISGISATPSDVTAASANTVSSVVLRDSSGNFSAGTITASLTGAASLNLPLAGGTMSGAILTTNGTAGAPTIAPSADTDTGLYFDGSNGAFIATGGSEAARVKSGQLILGGSSATLPIYDNGVLGAEYIVAAPTGAAIISAGFRTRVTGNTANTTQSYGLYSGFRREMTLDTSESTSNYGGLIAQAAFDIPNTKTFTHTGAGAGEGSPGVASLLVYYPHRNGDTGTMAISNASALRIGFSDVTTSTGTNKYGLFVDAMSGASNNYAIFTGSTGSIHFGNLSASRVLTTDSSTNLASSSVTTTTLAFLDATSSIQTQLNTKAPTASPTFTGDVVVSSSRLAVAGSLSTTRLVQIGAATQSVLSSTTQIGIASQINPNSSATAYGIGVLSQVTTDNSSFTEGFASAFYENAFSKGGSSTVTRYATLRATATTSATNNAVLVDNEAWTGNYFINQTGTTASSLGGILTLTKNVMGLGSSSNILVTDAPASGFASVSGVDNTGYGAGVFNSITSANLNSAFGWNVMHAGSGTGASNSAFGQAALQTWSSGNNLIAIGNQPMSSGTVSGSDDIAIGTSSLAALTSAVGNICMGTNSCNTLSATGSYNLSFGLNSGTNLSTGSNNILLGHSTTASSGSVSNELNIGGGSNTGINSAFVGNGAVSATPMAVQWNGTGGSGTNIAGANVTYATGVGTGTGVSGDFIWKVAPIGSSGTTPNTLVEAMRIDTKTNVSVGNAALSTSATDGFLYIPTCAGVPSGTPTAKTGLSAIIVNSTDNKICFYNGAWKCALGL